jgi:RHS repeat-associated protein
MIMNGHTYKIISNQIGTPERVVDALTGRTVEELNFDEFGIAKEHEGRSVLPFGFAGGLYDNDTHLTHFGARDYDSEPGRFVSKAPVVFGCGQTKLYAYVLNDPINLIDRLISVDNYVQNQINQINNKCRWFYKGGL